MFIKKVDAELKEEELIKNNKIESDIGPIVEIMNESVEVEIVDSSEEVKVQTLKNNKQREEYISDEHNYELIDFLSNKLLQVYQLIDTPFIRIKVLCNDYNYCNDKNLIPGFRTLGFYKTENGALSSLISYNESSIIAWLRDNKI